MKIIRMLLKLVGCCCVHRLIYMTNKMKILLFRFVLILIDGRI